MSDTSYSWFNVTSWALRDWNAALSYYFDLLEQCKGDRRQMLLAQARLQSQRESYRQRVISWYWKLRTPMKIGDEVPNEVANLLAEEWDESTLLPKRKS